MTIKGRTEPRAILATLGAVFTAIVGSACCWLPLVLITLGFSAAGVGSFFDQYRPFFLVAAFVLLGVAWHYTYPTIVGRGWAHLLGRPKSVATAAGCCAASPSSTAVPSCCGTGPGSEPEDCCARSADTNSGPSPHRRFTLRQVNQLLLGLTTALVVVFALFPHWFGFLFAGSGRGDSAAKRENQQQIVLKVEGMTEACCATIVEAALRGVPGVSGTTVSHERGQAVVFVTGDEVVPPEALLQAVRDAGYEARVISGPAPSEAACQPSCCNQDKCCK